MWGTTFFTMLVSMEKPTGAPGELELVRNFINTIDLESGSDALADEAGLQAWLEDAGLSPADVTLTSADAARAREVREALRELLFVNHGDGPTPLHAIETLNAAAAAATLAVRFDDGGRAVLEPRTGGIENTLGRIFAIVVRAMSDGTWSRMKACRRDTCRWAFYDNSKNRSRNWCSMQVCGNRTKAEQFRRRRAAT